MANALECCPRCGTRLCDTTTGPLICPRCELAGALGEGEALPFSGVLGCYVLQSLIAHGGMGAIYRAYHRDTGQTVALKTMLTGRLANAEMRERFLREARLAAKLQHPHIVPLLEVGEAEGLPYIVMEFVPGKNLADIVRDGPLPPERAAVMVAKATQAVAYAHEQGVVHRDLKPANILLDEQGEPRVADFGLAKSVDLDATMQLTVTGQVLGSPGYLAPERVPQVKDGQSRDSNVADISSDVYSLGATLYHLVTGRPPFQAATLDAVLLQVLKAEPIAPRKLNPSVPFGLEAVCLKCLEKEPRGRYASAKELAEDLQRFLDGHLVYARPPGPAIRGWRWCRRRPVIAGLIGAILILLLAIVTVSVIAAARIQRDERRLRDQLAQSLFAQARAENSSEVAGKRDAALAAIAQAAAIRPTLALRNEAIAALAQPDLRLRSEISMPHNTPPGPHFITDPDGRYFVFSRTNELVFERRIDGKIEFTLKSPSGIAGTTPQLGFGGISNRWLRGFTLLNTIVVWDLYHRRLCWQSAPIRYSGIHSHLFSDRDELIFTPDQTNLVRADLLSGTVTNVGALPLRKAKFTPSPDGRLLLAYVGSKFWVGPFPDLNWESAILAPLPIYGVKWEQDASRVILILDDHSLWVWHVKTRRPVGRLSGHSDGIATWASDSSSRWMVTSGYDGKTRLWDMLSFRQEVFSAFAGAKLQWLPSEEVFALRMYGTNGLRYFDFERPMVSLALVPHFQDPLAPLTSISLSADGGRVIAAGGDSLACLDARTGKTLVHLQMKDQGPVYARFEPGERGVFVATATGVVHRACETLKDELVKLGDAQVIRSLDRCKSMVSDVAGHRLAFSDQQGAIHLRDHSGAWRVIPQKANGVQLAISPDGRWLAGGSFDQDWLRVWDTVNAELRWEFICGTGVTPGFTPQGQLFAVSSTDFSFWNLKKGTREASLPRDYTGTVRGQGTCSGDGQFIAFSRSRTRVDLLHAPTLELLASFEDSDNDTQLIALDEHGTTLIVGKTGHFLERWDLRRLRAELARLKLDWNLPPLPSEDLAAAKPLR